MQQPISFSQLFPNKFLKQNIQKHLEGSVILINRDFTAGGWTMDKNLIKPAISPYSQKIAEIEYIEKVNKHNIKINLEKELQKNQLEYYKNEILNRKKESNNAYREKAKKDVVDSGIQVTEAEIEEIVNKKLAEEAIKKSMASGPVVEQSFSQEDITGTPINQMTSDTFFSAQSKNSSNRYTPVSPIAINFSNNNNFGVMNATAIIEPSPSPIPVDIATAINFNPTNFNYMSGPELKKYHDDKYGKDPKFTKKNLTDRIKKLEQLQNLERIEDNTPSKPKKKNK